MNVSTRVVHRIEDLLDVSFTGLSSGDFVKYDGANWDNRTAVEARTDLGLVIGTDVQAWSTDLDTLASVTHNFGAGVAPGVNDDVTGGYGPGSIWIDTTADKAYVCLDGTDTAAVWTETTQSGGGGSVATDAIWDAAGDLVYGTGADTAARLAPGTADQVLHGGTTPSWGAVDLASAQVTGLLPSANVSVNILGAPTYTTLEDRIDTNSSGGIITGGVVTDGGSGTADVSAGTVMIRPSDSDVATLYSADFAGVTGQVLTDNSVNYLYVEYNAGTPQITVSTSPLADVHSNIILGIVYRSGTTLYITNVDTPPQQVSQLLGKRFAFVDGLTRQSGSVTSEVGTRQLAVTAGKWWLALSEYSLGALDTSVADTFSYWYDDGAGGFTEVAAQTTIDNTQYDNGTGSLATLSNSKYGVHWVYQSVVGELDVVYGTTNGSLTEAEEAAAPTNLPIQMGGFHSALIAKIVIQKSASTFTTLQNPFVTQFVPGVPSAHGDLSDLGWTAGGHTGTLSNLAGFDGAGLASEYTLSGTGTEVALTTSPVLTTPQINDTSSDHQYIFGVSELAADRTVTLPLLAGNDTFVFEGFGATLTNKTIDGDNNTLSNLDIGNEVDWAVAADVADGGGAYATGDKLLIFEAGVGLRKIDWTDLPAGGGSVATDTIWDAAGDLVYGTGADTAARLAPGTTDQVLHGGTTPSWGAVDLATAQVTGILPSANLDADTCHLGVAQTFTGAKTFDTGTLLLNDTDSLFELALASTSTITAANKTLTFDVNDANRTLTISGDATVSGTNTGDSQTLAAGVSDVTATATELNLLDLAGLTVGWVLSADSATTASWKAPGGGSGTVTDLNGADNRIAVWTGATEIEGTSDFTFDGADLTIYNAVNDGNPEIRLGAADAEELHIQAVYDTGAQTLDYVLFQTDAASATANKGAYRFNVDGTDILDINDTGLVLGTSGITCSGLVNLDSDGAILRIPCEAAPTLALDGSLAVDQTVTDFSHGILKYFYNEILCVIAVPDAQLTTPTDGHVIKYNATNDEFELAGSGTVTDLNGVDSRIAVWTGATEIEGDADFTFDTATNTLAIAGVAGTSILAQGGANILVDSPRGTMTLSNIDALDATTEATIEAAIDTLANLTSAAALVTTGTVTTGTWASDITGGAGDTLDFGAGDSLEVPNGAGGTTLDASGEVCVDTTDKGGAGTFHFYDDGGERVLSPELCKSITIEDPVENDLFGIFITNKAITVTEIQAICEGGTSVVCNVEQATTVTAAGTLIDQITPTTAITSETTITSAAVPADRVVSINLGTVTGTVNSVTVTINYVIDP